MMVFANKPVHRIMRCPALCRFEFYDSQNNLLGYVYEDRITSQQLQQIMEFQDGGHRQSPQAGNRSPSKQPNRSTGRAQTPYPNLTREAPIPHAGIRAGEIVAPRCWLLEHIDRRHAARVDHRSLTHLLNDAPAYTHIVDPGWRLFSVFMQYEWVPKVPMTGMVDDDEGVHAFNDYSHVSVYVAAVIHHWYREKYQHECMFSSRVNSMPFEEWVHDQRHEPPPVVIGQVALWGEVVTHERGYRASHAKIARIDHIMHEPDDVYLNPFYRRANRGLDIIGQLRRDYI